MLFSLPAEQAAVAVFGDDETADDEYAGNEFEIVGGKVYQVAVLASRKHDGAYSMDPSMTRKVKVQSCLIAEELSNVTDASPATTVPVPAFASANP